MKKLTLLIFVIVVVANAQYILQTTVDYAEGGPYGGHPSSLYAEYTLTQTWQGYQMYQVTVNSDDNPNVFTNNWYDNTTGITQVNINRMGLTPNFLFVEKLTGIYYARLSNAAHEFGDSVLVGNTTQGIELPGRAGGQQGYTYSSVHYIDWLTAVEGMEIEAVSLNNAARVIWRAVEKDNAAFIINNEIVVPSKSGNSNTFVEYEYLVENLVNGKEYTFTVQAQDIWGKLSDPVSVKVIPGIVNDQPVLYELAQNYPNPFNPETKIEFTLFQPGQVTLKVFNITGQEIATLVNEYKSSAKTYSCYFDAGSYNIASGVYFYVLNVNDFVTSRKMVLIK
jgi:hypothetical protein